MPVTFIPHPAASHQTSTSMLCMLQALGPSPLCNGCTPAVTSFLSGHQIQLRKLLLEIPHTDLPESMRMIVNDMEGGKVLTRPPADNAPCRVFTMAGRVLRRLSPSKSIICTCRAAGISLFAFAYSIHGAQCLGRARLTTHSSAMLASRHPWRTEIP